MGTILRHSEHGRFWRFFLWHGALATVWCTICWPDLPKVLRGCQCKSSSRYGPVHFVDKFCRSRSESAETETLLRRPQQPHCPTKAQGFAPGSAFTCESKRFRTVTLRNCLMMGAWLTWWCGWQDDVVDMMATTTVRTSEVFQLNCLWIVY